MKNLRCELFFSITNIINFIAENMAISCRYVFKRGKDEETKHEVIERSRWVNKFLGERRWQKERKWSEEMLKIEIV